MNPKVILLTLISFIAMAAGFAREIATAYYFGTTASADAFSLVLLYIDGIASLMMTGVGGYLLVPFMTREAEVGNSEDGYRLMETILLWSGLLGMVFFLIGQIWPKILARIIAPDFSTAQHQILTGLLKLSVLSVLFILLGGVMAGVLQAKADYYSPTFGRALFSLGIALVWVLGAHYLGVKAGAIGLIVGALAQLLFQMGALWRQGWRPAIPRLWHSALPKIFLSGVPILIALLLINVFMGGGQWVIASVLPEGSLAAVNYASRTVNIVSSVSGALATISLTELSVQYHATQDGEETRKSLKSILETGIFLMTPLSFLLFFVSEPLIALLFHRGQYDVHSMLRTTQCLRWFIFSIVPGMIVAVLHRACPAFWRPWRTTLISLLWTLSTIVATWFFIPAMKETGVPAAYVVGMVIACVASTAALWDLIGKLFAYQLMKYFLKITLFSSLAMVPAMIVQHFLLVPSGGRWTWTSSLADLFSVTFIFGLSFLAICAFRHEPQFGVLSHWLRRILNPS